MAVAVEVLVERARIMAEQAKPFPELGIDWWDVDEYCPFHGFYAWDNPCRCEAERVESLVEDYEAREVYFDRVADRERLVLKENRW